jgi:rare lipoprotein A
MNSVRLTMPTCASVLLLGLACTVDVMSGFTLAATPANASTPAVQREDPAVSKSPLDRSGHKRVGKASFYAKRFVGKKMADGKLMQSQGNNAASKTLPLGTTAKVTNLDTGQSAVVTIEDRGPYVKDRIVDLSPATAHRIGIDQNKGVANVAIAPIAVPQPDGTVKPGVAAKSQEAGQK